MVKVNSKLKASEAIRKGGLVSLATVAKEGCPIISA